MYHQQKQETYTKLIDWMEDNLTKTEYDYYSQNGHRLINVSQKTWHNYKYAKTTIPFVKMQAIIRLLGHHGLNIHTIVEDHV